MNKNIVVLLFCLVSEFAVCSSGSAQQFVAGVESAHPNYQWQQQQQALREFCQFIHRDFRFDPCYPNYPTSYAYMAALQAYARLPYLLPDGRVNPDLTRFDFVFISRNREFNCAVSNAVRLLRKIENPHDDSDLTAALLHKDYLQWAGQNTRLVFNRILGILILG